MKHETGKPWSGLNKGVLSVAAGQAIIALVLFIGGIITVLALAIAFLTNSFINTTAGFQAAEKAQAVATAGAQDALTRLNRNKSLSGIYKVSTDGDSATVTVSQDTPTTTLVTILSSSTVSMRQKVIKVIVSRDPVDGTITLISWEAQ